MFGVYLICHIRKRLFNLINDVPTVLDVVTGKKPLRESLSSAKVKDATTVISHKSNGKANSSTIQVVKIKKIKKIRSSHPFICLLLLVSYKS
jgi:PII-like signaling protein